MNQNSDRDLYKLKRIQAWYNLIPNLGWSLLNLIPISVFCYTLLNLKLLYIFLVVSIAVIFLPNSFFDKTQLGNTTSIYKKLGVHIINKFSQNGDIVNRLIRKKFPDYKLINFQSSSINRLLKQTYIFEKFHFIMFVFFCLVTVYAITKNYVGWAITISITNLAYNIYPNLLQQYIRIKLQVYVKKLKSN